MLREYDLNNIVRTLNQKFPLRCVNIKLIQSKNVDETSFHLTC